MAAVAYRLGGISLKWSVAMGSSGRVSVLSTEAVSVAVSADVDGAPYDPTALPVDFAFMQDGAAPGSSDWHAGSWNTSVIGSYAAQVVVGPDGVALAEGRYQVWVQITDADSGETVVRQPASLLVE